MIEDLNQLRESIDVLDSEILKVSGKDVPMPYAENLEALALPTKDEILSAVKKVTYKN